MRWIKYRTAKTERDGLWLVRLDDGSYRLGVFYCGAFVMDGFAYGQTPGMIGRITHIQKVIPLQVSNERGTRQ